MKSILVLLRRGKEVCGYLGEIFGKDDRQSSPVVNRQMATQAIQLGDDSTGSIEQLLIYWGESSI